MNKLLYILISILFTVATVQAQYIQIVGPTTVQPNEQATYGAINYTPTPGSTFYWNVNGGTIIEESTHPMACYVIVQWYTTPGDVFLTYNNNGQYQWTGLSVEVGQKMEPGVITVSNPIVDYNGKVFLTGTAATALPYNTPYGPYYLYYQWEYSTDGYNFYPIDGATGQNYTHPALTANTYFRRLAGNYWYTDYSNTVYVSLKPFAPGKLTVASDHILSGTVPQVIQTPASGGDGNYTYTWEINTGSGWVIAGTGINFPGTILTTNASIRCKVACGSTWAYTNTLDISMTAPNALPDPLSGPYYTHETANYIRVWEPLIPIDGIDGLETRAVNEVRQSTEYFDLLGKPMQSVVKQGSLDTRTGALRDMVTPYYRNGATRGQYSYLPFVANTADGLMKTDPFQQQAAFFQSQFGGQEHFFYGHTEVEPSPLGRTTKAMAPGDNWTGSGRGIEVQYQINTAKDSVKRWTYYNNPGGIVSSTAPSCYSYPAGELRKKVTIDEHGKQLIEYSDKSGNMVLKKVQLTAQADNGEGSGHSGWLCTYYVYLDHYNLPLLVLQPLLVEKMNQAGVWSASATELDEQGFRYSYDGFQRLAEKKVPGAAVVYTVYDQRHRPVFAQDGNMRQMGQWLYTLYDELNRPVETGKMYYNSSRQSLQQYVDSHTGRADAGNPLPPGAQAEPLTFTRYDTYDGLSGLSATIDNSDINSNYFVTSYDAAPYYAQQVKASALNNNRVTWTQTAVPDQGRWITSVNLYDEKGRLVQTKTINHTGGQDVATTQYDWSGKVLRTHLKQQKAGAQAITIATANTYDALGRISKLEKNINNSGWKTITQMEYDALGQVRKKTLGNNLESQDFDYNIRGWVTSMNKGFITDQQNDRFFGYELGYDKPAALLPQTSYLNPQYNGNISGQVWKSKGDSEKRKYDYTYDPVNRLTGADFTQYTGSSFNKNAGIDFSVSNLAYDANGNILSMYQMGLKGMASTMIDRLSYSYLPNSNRLKQVIDDANDYSSTLGDFKYDPARKGSQDYAYDVNGNLIRDNNKGITWIEYNYLNLPVKIATDKGTISYDYDAAGNKLQKIVDEWGGDIKFTDYVGAAVYENNQLQFVSHEEGRARISSGVVVYDYYIKDHLGNIRMTLTDEVKTDIYPVATLEPANLQTEKQIYDINDGYLTNKYAITGFTAAAGSNYPNNNGIPAGSTVNPDSESQTTYRVNGDDNKTGLGITLKVMSGDKLNVLGKSYYFQNNSNNDNNYQLPVESLLAGLLGGAGAATAGGHVTAAELASNTETIAPIQALLSQQQSNNYGSPQKPRAYINYLLFDEQFKCVGSGSSQVGNVGEIKTHSELQNIAVNKNGYIYVYCSNQSPLSVYFDNLQVTHEHGKIVSEDHYYPYGLIQQGISSHAAGSVYNPFKFQGENSDFDTETGWNNFLLRNYDPQIGRFWQLDPYDQFASGYIGLGNNPVNGIDMDGGLYEDWLKGLTAQGTEYAGTQDLQEVVVKGTRKDPREKGGILYTGGLAKPKGPTTSTEEECATAMGATAIALSNTAEVPPLAIAVGIIGVKEIATSYLVDNWGRISQNTLLAMLISTPEIQLRVLSKGGKQNIANEYSGSSEEELRELYKQAKAKGDTVTKKKLQQEAKRLARKQGKNKISLED